MRMAPSRCMIVVVMMAAGSMLLMTIMSVMRMRMMRAGRTVNVMIMSVVMIVIVLGRCYRRRLRRTIFGDRSEERTAFHP